MDSMLRSELNSLRDECDWLDYPGTPGRPRLRETCRMELGHFLLYVACGDFFQTREQAALLNTVWEGVIGMGIFFLLGAIFFYVSARAG